MAKFTLRKSQSSLSDFVQVMESAEEFARLKNRYLESIERLDKTTSETKESVALELKNIKEQFLSDASVLLNKLNEQYLEKNEALLSSFASKFENKVQEADDKIKTIHKGEPGDKGAPGESPDIDRIVELVLAFIPLPKDGKDAFLDEKAMMNLIIEKVLEKGLEIKDVKNLEERLRNLGSKVALGGHGGGGQGSWKQKTLSGTINGSNTIFTFAGDPFAEFSEHVYLNYISQNPFTDYTISGNTITYTTAPDASLSGFPHIIRGM